MSSILNFVIRKFLPKSLLARFMMIIIIPTLVAQLLSVYLFYQRHWYNVSNQISGFIATEISSFLNVVDYEKTPNQKRSYLNFDYIYIPNFVVENSNIRHIKEIEIFKNTLKKELGRDSVVIIDDDNNINFYLKAGSGTLKIILKYKSIVNPTTYVFVLWIIFLTILLLSISLIFSKNQIKSIIELTNAAEKYGRGDRDYSYKPSGAQEIRHAGLSFLKMKERIERQTAKRTQMLAMISHDLKTPLTRMKLQLELMDESEAKEEFSYDINSMKQMIASYLDFARGEGGENFESLDIKQYLEKYLNNKWSNANIISDFSKDAAFVKIKYHAFGRALSNLISNSLKYATKVKILFYVLDESVFIEIEDNGSGIKEEELDLVFKPFYRSEKSRPLVNNSSVGLGLAITKEIIKGHYGDVVLEKGKDLKGLKAVIQLPIDNK